MLRRYSMEHQRFATQAPLVFDDSFHAAPIQIQRSAGGLAGAEAELCRGTVKARRAFDLADTLGDVYPGSWTSQEFCLVCARSSRPAESRQRETGSRCCLEGLLQEPAKLRPKWQPHTK